MFGNKKLVALDIGTSSVKLAEIDMGARGPILRKFGVMPLAPGTIVNGEILDFGTVSGTCESLVSASRTKRKNAITGMWGNTAIIKKISMPKMDSKLVAEQLKWEAEQYIPFDINEVCLEYHILSGKSASSESMDVLLVAAKQEYVYRFIECIEAAKIKCAVVDIDGFALANCFEANYASQATPIALVNIGAGVTNFVAIVNGDVHFCRDISVGGGSITNDISKSMGVSVREAEALKISASFGQEVPAEVNSIIASANEQIVEEIKNSFDFYAATANGTGCAKFYVSGGSVFIPGLVEQIAKAVSLPFEPFDPFNKIQYDKKVFTAEYIDQIKAICPVALGLAMRKISDR